MASHQTQTRSFALWDSANPDEQEIVSKSAKYKDLLNNKLDDLTDLVRLSDMWPTLKALSVIDQRAKDRILQGGIPAEAVEKLVRNLDTGMTWRLHGFIRALYKTDQQHIINLLGLKVADYDDTPVQYRPPPQKMIQPSSSLLPGGNEGCAAVPADSVRKEPDSRTDNLTGTAATHEPDGKPDLKAMMKNIQEELKKEEVQLLESTGIGGLAGNRVFIAHLRTLKILLGENIQEIEACATDTAKTSKLIKYLLPIKPTKYILLAWVLIQMEQEHHLKTSITKDIKKYLRKLSKEEIEKVEEDMYMDE